MRLATLGGAAALGLADRIGSLEVGKRADVIAVDVTALHTMPTGSPWSAIAYAAKSGDVRHVAVDGNIVVRDRALLTLEVPKVRERARKAAGATVPLMRVLVFLLLAACSQMPRPTEPSSAALFRDLERQVTIGAATGWGVDRIEIESILKGTLDSVCRVDPLARRQLRQWIDGELQRLGAPVETAYHERGKKLSNVEDLLVMTRISKLLARAEEVANECPFWVEIEEPFTGRQISDGRWQVSFGGGGKGIIVRQGDRQDINAGGAGRLLFGRTLRNGDALYAGIEIGGSAAFPKDESGERSSLVIGADIVAPLIYRRTITNAYLEFEGGWLGHSTEADWGDFDHGVHVGFALGARALRTRFVFPGVALGISYERIFLDGDDVRTIKVGARVAFDLDL